MAGGGVPDDELAVEDQAVGELGGGRRQVAEPVLDQGAAPALQQQPASGSCGVKRIARWPSYFCS
ncbi:hypothetical protein [Streptomyces sp. NBC_01264]|uniref:hypothetical protein n=1 Tax=Streptomyces sp. NBC_01264 TaxID=2903804 RepID=UPI002B1D47B5|nr:hypothetical protein [Streptomyces sp. NBC_01264]